MKKIFILFGIVLVLVILLGADIRRDKENRAPTTTKDQIVCQGYTIIEFGKAVNCEGDTVKLVKVKGGGQALASAP